MVSWPRLTSRQHALVKRCRAAASARRPDGEVLLDGEHLCTAALDAGIPIAALLTDGRSTAVARRAHATGAPVYEGTTAVLEAASPVRAPTGVVAIAMWTPAALTEVIATKSTRPRGVIVGLVDVQDPGNLGAVIRSADAFGAAGVVALGASADPGSWKALRGAMGSTFRLPVSRGLPAAAVETAEARGWPVAAAVARGGEPLDRVNFGDGLLLLLGNEGAGLDPALIDRATMRLSIPMRDGVDSLNVATTASVVLYDAARQRQGATGGPR